MLLPQNAQMMNKTNLKSHNQNRRRGAILVLAAILLTVLLAMAAFAIDIGYISSSKTQLQNTADAAALAGCLQLSNGSSAVLSAAQSVGVLNSAGGYTINIQSQDVVLGSWNSTTATLTPLTGTATSNANAVQVTCYLSSARGTPLNLFFASVLGSSYANITTTATASLNSQCGMIIGLPLVTMSGGSYTDSYYSAEGPYSAATAGTNGTVCSNGNITMSGPSVINGDAHAGAGSSVQTSGSSHVTGQTQQLTTPLSYANVNPGNAASSNNNNAIPLSNFGKQPLDSNGNFSLSGGDGVTLPAGTYYFATLVLSGGSTIQLGGPTIVYVTGNVNISGGSVTNTAMLPKNFQLFPMGSQCNISGSSDFYGVVYGPSTEIIRSASSGYFGAIVGAELVMSGSGGIHADRSLTFSYLQASSRKASLVQ